MLTYKYRSKDHRAEKALCAHAYAVNQVWNYAVAQQRDTEQRCRAGEKPRKWASHSDSQRDGATRRGPQGQKGLRIRAWECSSCGKSHDRDVNAARSILALARSATRPVEESRRAA